MPLYPSVNSAAVDVLTKQREGSHITDATMDSTLFGLLSEPQQRVVLDLVSAVNQRQRMVDEWIGENLRNPRNPLPAGVLAILSLGIAQLDQAKIAPRLIVSSLVGQTTDQGFTPGMAKLVNALLVSYSLKTDAEGKHHEQTQQPDRPAGDPQPSRPRRPIGP